MFCHGARFGWLTGGLLLLSGIACGAPGWELGPHVQAVLDEYVRTADALKELELKYAFTYQVALPENYFEGAEVRSSEGTLSEGDGQAEEMVRTGEVHLVFDRSVLRVDLINESTRAIMPDGRSKDIGYRSTASEHIWVFDPDTAVIKKYDRPQNPGQEIVVESVRVTSGTMAIRDVVISNSVLPELLHLSGIQRVDAFGESRFPEFPPYSVVVDEPSSAVVLLRDEVPVWAVTGGHATADSPLLVADLVVDRSTSRTLQKTTCLFQPRTKSLDMVGKISYKWGAFEGIWLPTEIDVVTPGAAGDATGSGSHLKLRLAGAPRVQLYPAGEHAVLKGRRVPFSAR